MFLGFFLAKVYNGAFTFFIHVQSGESQKDHLLVTDENEDFRILDYEADAEFVYTYHRWRFYAIPTYVIPVNAGTLPSDNGTYKETLHKGFYVTIGIRVTL